MITMKRLISGQSSDHKLRDAGYEKTGKGSLQKKKTRKYIFVFYQYWGEGDYPTPTNIFLFFFLNKTFIT